MIASCCNEAFKIATTSAAFLNNYFMLIGTEGVYSYTFEHGKRDDCPVCGGESLETAISKDWTVDRLIEMLVEKQDMYATFLSGYLSSRAHIFLRTDRLRNLRCRQLRSRFISRLHPNLRKQLGLTWKRRSQSWWRLAMKSSLQLRPCRLACRCVSGISDL